MTVFHVKPQARTPRARSRGDAGGGVGGVLWGGIGWLLAIGVGIWAVLLVRDGRASLVRTQALREANRAQRQTELQQQEMASAARRKQLVETINAEVATQEKLLKGIAESGAAAASLLVDKAERETRRNRLKAGGVALKSDVEVMGEGIQELQARITALQKEKIDLMKEYAERYRRMKKLYEERLVRPEPEMLRQFYQTHQNTPFAPAALFFTAEKLFQKRRSSDAQRFYEDLIKKFPDSAYLQPAQKRLSDIQARLAYEPIEELGFVPYKALRFVESM
jgi:chromosome segregation ATPase